MEPGISDDTVLRILGWTAEERASREEQRTEAPKDEPAPKATEPAWEPPIPLAHADPPPFPTDVLPGYLKAYVEAQAVALQVPVDLVACCVLGTLSSVWAGRYEVKVRDGYAEIASLYIATILPPGERKSATFSDATEPLALWEAEQAKSLAREIAESKATVRMLSERMKSLEGKAAKEDDRQRRDELMKEAFAAREELEEVEAHSPIVRRHLLADITVEALGMVLAEQNGRAGLMSAEGSILSIAAGRYSKGDPNLELLLACHAGDHVSINRVGRAPISIPRPSLSMCLCVQPAVLRRMGAEKVFDGQGFLARFLYSMPRPMRGRRDAEPEPCPVAVQAIYRAGVLAMLGTEDPEPRPYLTLSREAYAEFIGFQMRAEAALGEGGELEYLAEWGSKAHGAVARIAGLLHAAEYPEGPWRYPIAGETMRAAAAIGEYFVAHAKVAFHAMRLDDVGEACDRILRWVRRERRERFSKRDCHQDLRGGMPLVEMFDEPLKRLVDHGYLAEVQSDHQGPGRKPSPLYRVNPYAHGHAPKKPSSESSQSPPPPRKGSCSANSEDSEDRFQEVKTQGKGNGTPGRTSGSPPPVEDGDPGPWGDA
ncbi:MAG: DUF3987 domain-containing protein [Deltaproteobacteria bacterium]|nr:DUF3987 domain-containing protein [Deltaproteobacteria bacterium]